MNHNTREHSRKSTIVITTLHSSLARTHHSDECMRTLTVKHTRIPTIVKHTRIPTTVKRTPKLEPTHVAREKQYIYLNAFEDSI